MPQVTYPKPKPKKPAWMQKDNRQPMHNYGAYTPAPPGGAGYVPPGYGPNAQQNAVQMPGAPTSTQGGGGYYTGQTWHTSNYGPYQHPTQGYYVGHYPAPQARPPATAASTSGGSSSGFSSGWGGGWGGWGGGGGGGGSARDVAAWAALVAWNINR